MLPKNASLRHVALAVHEHDECEKFYNMLGMKTELKTEDYVYLSGHGDNENPLLVTESQENHEKRIWEIL